jgi:TRAP-type C4-dicarboxylate transport system substrate-binding protein
MTQTSSDDIFGIGQRIRAARKSMELRQSDLSEMTGLPASHLSDIERGILLPTVPTLRKIGQALNRPLGYFFEEEDARPRSLGMVIHGSSIGGQAAAHFAQVVEEKTEGCIKPRIYHHAALGTAREQVEGLAEGAIDIYIDEPLSFEGYAGLCGWVFLPYFFRDRDHYQRFLRSSLFEEHVYRKLLNSGIRLLNPASNWECGSFELLFSMQPIFHPVDLAGRKMRSYASDAAIALRRALGARPVVVEWQLAYQAFQEGLVDAFLTPAAYFYSLGMHEVARYATFLSYGYTLNLAVAMNEREYRKLPPDVQQILSEATHEAGTYCTRLANEQTVGDLERLSEEHGLPVIQPSQAEWRGAFESAIRGAWQGPARLYEELQSL